MKTIIASFIALATLTGTASFAQTKNTTDPSVSARNYKHADKAEYAKKNNLEKQITISESETIQNNDYKHSDKKVLTKKAGMAVKNKPHPNYKHQ